MAEVILKDIVKVYPFIEKKEKKAKKNQEPKKKTNLQITDKGVIAVQQFNLHIKDGEFIVLVGPSGCGKSTTLRMVAGLEEITEGELYIDGQLVNAVEPKDRDIAMVFQSYALYPHMTVYQNMAYALKIRTITEEKEVVNPDGSISTKTVKRHYSKEEIDSKVREAAEILNITDYLNRKPKNLSGGQRQRVAIGRAIVRNPKVLLMDEPLSNLDAKLRNQMRAEIIKLRSRIHTTFIYVTHDQVEAMTLGDRIVVMKDGFIQQIGSPQEVFDHPKNIFVSGFIGTPQMNYFSARLLKRQGKYVAMVGDYAVTISDDKCARLEANGVDEQYVILGVRPDHMRIKEQGVPGIVEVSELMGTSYHLHLSVAGKDVIAIVPNSGTFTDLIGKKVNLGFSGNVVHLFSKENQKNLEFINEATVDSVEEANQVAAANSTATSTN